MCCYAQDEETSDWALEAPACPVYVTDETGATIRLVCIPASQLNLDASTLTCAECKFNC